jgi:GMP synthase-like glutamine amidotransferase
MKIHYLQHVPFEDLGMMEPVLTGGGHTLTSTKFFGPHELPSIHNLDWLIVMGGPMGVNDEAVCPWRTHEKKLIEAAVRHHKPVLGICLGAQLIAQVLGNRVIGFQFHLESTLQTVQNLIINCGDELDGSAYVQSETKMLAEADFPGLGGQIPAADALVPYRFGLKSSGFSFQNDPVSCPRERFSDF